MRIRAVFSILTFLCLCSRPLMGKQLPRRFDPKENDPYRIKYIAYLDQKGRIKIDNLAAQNQAQTQAQTKAVVQDVTFHLFTKNNLENPDIVRAEDITDLSNSPNYSPTRQNYFLIHGWQGSASSRLNVVIKNAVLSKFDINVFVVDWSGPANSGYLTAMAAVPQVGQFIGTYINQMMDLFGVGPSNFELVGHSLGAHVAGAAGAATNGLVSYIMGLDPAGPGYTVDNPSTRIDETDGEYVIIMHTNGGRSGFQSSIGHIDFFPNGGDWQVGCEGSDSEGSCSHNRCTDYLEESILTSGFVAHLCSTYEDYSAGLCLGNQNALMGEYVIDKSLFGDYYLNTNGQSPFAQG